MILIVCGYHLRKKMTACGKKCWKIERDSSNMQWRVDNTSTHRGVKESGEGSGVLLVEETEEISF